MLPLEVQSNASIMDLSNRFRLLVNEVDVVKPAQPLPKLPGRACRVGVPALLQDCLRGHGFMPGGAHHTGFSYAVTTQHMEDFAEIAGLEPVIDGETELPDFKQQLRYNEIYYHLAPRLGRL
jgi:L-arabinose isomerase